MHKRISTIAFPLLALALTGGAIKVPATTGSLPTPANRIVGLWSTQATVSLCGGGGMPMQIRNNLLFHAGGTVTENIPPLTSRNQGLGVWSYDRATGLYSLRLHFDRFAGGVHIGSSTVDRQMTMSPDRQEISGPVYVVHYALDGTSVDLCGEAVSERLQ